MSKLKDVVGEVYNRFVITEMLPHKKYGKNEYKFVRARCICGNIRDVCYKDLTKGRRKSCGCYAKEYEESSKVGGKIGDVYGLWTVLEEGEGYYSKSGERQARTVICKCICGKEKEVHTQSLVKGKSKSCGCNGVPKKKKIEKVYIIPEDTEEEQWKESVTFPKFYISTLGGVFSYNRQKYLNQEGKNSIEVKGKQTITIKEMYKVFVGEYDESIYSIWSISGEKRIEQIYILETKTERALKIRGVYSNMKERCYNKKCTSYKSYGEKGIKIEDSFSTFEKFLTWSLNNGYKTGLEIDRIDWNKNYSEHNCRYITKNENILNGKHLNLTLEDVEWIRSDDFSYEEASIKFTCSKAVIKNIREYKTFKNL